MAMPCLSWWTTAGALERFTRGPREAVKKVLSTELRSHVLDSQRCLQIDKLKQTRKSHGAPFRPFDKESIVLCICICSNKKVQFRGSHFISAEKRKKKQFPIFSIWPHFSFAGLTSMFLESSSSGVAVTSLFRK